MAEISGESGGGPHKHRGPRSKKANLRVDLTPMVDLAFLLITFFMLSMEMRSPGAVEWQKQVKDTIAPAPVPECCVLNILVDSADRVYTYEGQDLKTLRLSSFDTINGVGLAVTKKRIKVHNECGVTTGGKPHELVCIIKLLPGARYKNLTDVIDEMNVTKTNCYGIQDPLPEEVAELKTRGKELAVK